MIETRSVGRQLLEFFQGELASGKWKPGDRFFSEREISLEHRISRATANKVLSKLASEGWLEFRKGIGSFVAERPTLFASLRRMESFTELARLQGFQPSTRVLEFKRLSPPDPALSQKLDLAAGEKILRLVRLRFLDGEPVIYEERWLPEKRYPGLAAQDLAASFYDLCRGRFGLVLASESAEIRASPAPPCPRIDWNCPALCLTGTGYDPQDVPLWTQRLFYRGDRFVLTNNKVPSSDPAGVSLNFSNRNSIL